MPAVPPPKEGYCEDSKQQGGVITNGETGSILSSQGKPATQPPAAGILLHPLILWISLLRAGLSQKSDTSFIHPTRIYHFPGMLCASTNLEMSESI